MTRKRGFEIFMIGTTHFDPVWMWTWDEAMASIRATFRAALERMREEPDFIYSFSCPPVFEWVRRVDPALFAEIRRRVKEGRWELVEGWWVQPDCNVASGESYARQGLYGQRYLMEHFGRLAVAGFNTDSFGHNAMLPQILVKSGLTAYVFGRPSETHRKLPGPLFAWRSPDGSEIAAFRCGSDGANSYPLDVRTAIATLGATLDRVGHDMMLLYGVSNHGGAPTRQALADINACRAEKKAAFGVRFGSVAEFFRRRSRAGLPVVTGELQTGDFGVLANHTGVKRNNRLAEYALGNAERLALLCGGEYPAEALRLAWRDVLFNQFHDIIGGASVKPAYFDARNLHGRALQAAGEIVHYSLQSLTKEIDTDFEGFPLVVFNPNPFELETGVEAELQWAWEFPWYDGDLAVTGPDGGNVPCQVIRALSALPRFRSRFTFRDRVPALGYKVYQVRQASQSAGSARPMSATPAQLENERYLVRIDPATGFIAGIEDKLLGRPIAGAVGLPRVHEDRGDTWAFNIDGYGPEAGAFALESLELVECGPVRACLRTKARCLDSTFEQDIILYRGSDAVEGRFRVHWRERRRALKLCFEATMAGPTLTAAIPFGAIERPADGREMPAGEWLSLDEAGWGLSLLADSVFAYDARGAALNLTLLRSPIYAHHGHPLQRYQIDETLDWDYQEQGCRAGRWQLLAHRGDWRDAGIPARAAAFNNPVLMVTEANHPGARPRQDTLLAVAARSVLVTAVKQSEEGADIVIRLYEYAGREDEAIVTVRPIQRTFKVRLGPYEIKTVMLEKAAGWRPVETDLLEREEGEKGDRRLFSP